jgi:hypothetical protein
MTLDQLGVLVAHHEERTVELGMVGLHHNARGEVDVLRAEVTALRKALDASRTRDQVVAFISRLDCIIAETEAILSMVDAA